ncbi:MAG: DUF2393 domain-containing protein [Acidobacteriia bacterium]|nr:DUF2393 domain-containing protein [Terriglobia bacterium]
MAEDFPRTTGWEPSQRRGFGLALLFGAGVVVLVVFVAYLLLVRFGNRPTQPLAPLPMGTTEQAYASQIEFSGVQMSRAENFLGQEVTYLFCVVTNRGARTVRQMEVAVEFRDAFQQVVLRDTRRVIGPRAAPLRPGASRELQLSWEHIPADWNHQYPSIRITGLLLE